MKKILYIIFAITLLISLNNVSFAETNLDKIKNKIKSTEKKVIDNLWGSNDCSHISTKTMTGLAKYNKCKRGIEESDSNISEKKKKKTFDLSKPCHEYSSKTFAGLAAKIKCKRAKKN